MSVSGIAYPTVRMGLRPPRAVVVFNGGDHWTYWARRAQYLAGQVWGGCNFALIPHRNGQVDPVLLRACRAYDPDYVVVLPVTVGEIEQLRPGWFQVKGADGQLAVGQERDRMLDEVNDDTVPVNDDMAARNLIADICSTYRTRLDDSWDEDVYILEPGDRSFHNALSVSGIFPGSDLVLNPADLSVLACPPTWGGMLGVLTASAVGAVEAPELAAGEPDLDDQPASQLTSWLLGTPSTSAPDQLRWTPAEGMRAEWEPMPTAHTRSMAGLVPVTVSRRSRTGLVVLGDEPEDFALARLWQLTFGFGQWLPSILDVDQAEPPWQVTHGIGEMLYKHKRRAATLAATSVSRPVEHVRQVYDRLLQDTSWIGDDAREATAVAPSTSLPWKGQSTTHLGVADLFDTYIPVPTVVDETGTRSMVAPLPAPILNTRYLLPPANLTWHVDIGWQPDQAVRGRGLDGQEVFTPETEYRLTWGRSSRNGISYQSHRFNWVIAGIPEVNKLARPAVRDLSLAAWIDAKGREHGFTTRPSTAGHRTALLTRLLGSRQQFVDLFSGPLLPALHALQPTSSSTTVAYPDNDGVALPAGEGALTFAGFKARTPELDTGQLRELLDSTLRAGVLRRGLVLQCRTCEEAQFQPVDKVGQTWTCARCGAPGDLSQPAWKQPAGEPTWYYNLHPAARHLLRDHGDVPAMLSAYLATERQTNPHAQLHDVGELEFVVNGKRQVEADLIAHVDETLTVAECKSTDNVAPSKVKAREEVRKKCQVAAWLQADHFIFATTRPAWTNYTPGVIRSAVAEFSWGPLGPPEVHLITGLGTSAPRNQLLPNLGTSAQPSDGG